MYTLYKSKTRIVIHTTIYEKGSYFYRFGNSDKISPIETTIELFFDPFIYKKVDTTYFLNRITKDKYKDICLEFDETQNTFFAFTNTEKIPITNLIDITKQQYYV